MEPQQSSQHNSADELQSIEEYKQTHSSQEPTAEENQHAPTKQVQFVPGSFSVFKLQNILPVLAALLIFGALGVYMFTKGNKNILPNTSETQQTDSKLQKTTIILNDAEATKQQITDLSTQDIIVRNNINSLVAKLEEYYNEFVYYPATFSTTDDSTFNLVDAKIFTDPLGYKIKILTPVSTSTEAGKIITPPAQGPLMQYVGYDCKANDECKGYMLGGYQAKTNTIVKKNLN